MAFKGGVTGTLRPHPPGYSPVKTSESLKCQLTSCEENQNTECQSKYNKEMRPGWPVLRKLWHIETTPFKKFMTNLKWPKLTRVPHYPTSTVKPKSYGDKTQMSFVREACIAFFPTWSLNFQIADTCTHCVPIFIFTAVLCSWVNFWSDYHDWNGSWLPDTLVAGFVYSWPVFVCESVGKYSWWCYGVWCSCWRMFWSVLFATNCYNLCALGLLSVSWSSCFGFYFMQLVGWMERSCFLLKVFRNVRTFEGRWFEN